MLQTVPAANITLRSLKQSFNLKVASNAQFFTEWQVETAPLSEIEQIYLDRVRGNFLDLLEEPAVLENSVKNSVKMVVLAPLLDLAGFYRRPFRITTETSIEINLEDEGLCIPSLILAMNSLRF